MSALASSTWLAVFYVSSMLFAVLPAIYLIWEKLNHRVRGLKDIKLPEGVVVLSGRAAIAEAVEVVVAAWAGSEPENAAAEMLHRWMLAPSAAEAHRPLLRWMVRFYLAYTQACPGSLVLGVRGADGTLAAVACVVPNLDGLPERRSQTDTDMLRGPVLGGLVQAARYVRARAQLGFSSLADAVVKRRFDDARAVLGKTYRDADMAAHAHLYLGPIAVKPAAQGQKHASKLMRHVNACADALNCACYSECSGARAKNMLTRLGYRPVGGSPLSVTAGKDAADASFGEVWAMERPLDWAALADGKYIWDFVDVPSMSRSKPAYMQPPGK